MSIIADTQFKMSLFAARYENVFRPASKLTTSTPKLFIRASYIIPAIFLGIAFPFLWTAEAGLQQTLVGLATTAGFIAFVSAILFMVVYRVGVDNGWIESKANLSVVSNEEGAVLPLQTQERDFASVA